MSDAAAFPGTAALPDSSEETVLNESSYQQDGATHDPASDAQRDLTGSEQQIGLKRKRSDDASTMVDENDRTDELSASEQKRQKSQARPVDLAATGVVSSTVDDGRAPRTRSNNDNINIDDLLEGANAIGKRDLSLSFLPTGGKKLQQQCTYCRKDITGLPRIYCADSSCPDFSLCVECFSVGVELREHRKDHPYRVSDCLNYSLFEKDWTADDELLLLEGIERFGFGNWKHIAEYVSTKTEKKCQQHYTDVYLLSPTAPLPSEVQLRDESATEKTLGGSGKKDVEIGEKLLPSDRPNLVEQTTSGRNKKTKKDRGRASTASAAGASGAAAGQGAASNTVDPRKLPGADLCGYMPLRGDFDVEHDNDAELILADMEFCDDDHPSERELKIRVVQIYNKKLDERERRKKFVLERGLLDYRKQQALERRRPKEEREIVAAMRPFARFHSAEEHQEFVEGLLTAMRLRKRIAQLQHYRKMGIRTLAEAEQYELEKRKREQDLALRKSKQSASYLYESGKAASSRERNSSRYLNRDKTSESQDRQDGTAIEEAKGSSSQKSPRTSDDPNASASATTPETPTSEQLLINSAPGADLLTDKEKALCSHLGLLPRHYMVIKDTLVRECFRFGYLSRDSASQLIKIDINKTNRIFDFFVTCGWIATAPEILHVTSTDPAEDGAGGNEDANASTPGPSSTTENAEATTEAPANSENVAAASNDVVTGKEAEAVLPSEGEVAASATETASESAERTDKPSSEDLVMTEASGAAQIENSQT